MQADSRMVGRVCRFKLTILIEYNPAAANLLKESGHWETDNLEVWKTDRTAISSVSTGSAIYRDPGKSKIIQP